MAIKYLRGDYYMDRPSTLPPKALLVVTIILLLTSTTGAALGHPVAEEPRPDLFFHWYYGLVQQSSTDLREHFAITEWSKEEEREDVRIVEHVVGKGDTIRSIAREYGIDETTITMNNNIRNANLIVIGQTLRFPSIDGLMYKVKRGDTLSQLANLYGITVPEILNANEVVATELSVGSTLILPNAKPVATQSTVVSRSASTVTSGLRNLVWPVSGVITSSYGWRKNPFNASQSQFHRGIDIGASRGTPILAATSGRVVHSGWINGYGYTVILEHGDDFTLYAHASSLSVRKGQWVNKGQEVARVGATGNATGPHLHFEVRVNGNSSTMTVNPVNYLR